MIIDQLFHKTAQNGNVCAGLDSHPALLPPGWTEKHRHIYEAWLKFNLELVDALLDVTACFKVQIACYEAYGIEGLQVYRQTLDYIRRKGGIVIADIKRNDIANTAAMYAKAHFSGDFEADFITLNAYLGMDSLTPYLPYIEQKHKGIFVLVRTSNPGAADFQDLSVSKAGPLWQTVGLKLQELGENYISDCGYSLIGAVVGCTHKETAAEMRSLMPKTFFLIPGFGAQGGKAGTAAALLNRGSGGVVNSSRGIILAYQKNDTKENFALCARKEAEKMRTAIAEAGGGN